MSLMKNTLKPWRLTYFENVFLREQFQKCIFCVSNFLRQQLKNIFERAITLAEILHTSADIILHTSAEILHTSADVQY